MSQNRFVSHRCTYTHTLHRHSEIAFQRRIFSRVDWLNTRRVRCVTLIGWLFFYYLRPFRCSFEWEKIECWNMASIEWHRLLINSIRFDILLIACDYGAYLCAPSIAPSGKTEKECSYSPAVSIPMLFLDNILSKIGCIVIFHCSNWNEYRKTRNTDKNEPTENPTTEPISFTDMCSFSDSAQI